MFKKKDYMFVIENVSASPFIVYVTTLLIV